MSSDTQKFGILPTDDPTIVAKVDKNNIDSVREVAAYVHLGDIKGIPQVQSFLVNKDVITIFMQKYEGDLSQLRPSEKRPYLKEIFWTLAHTLYVAREKNLIHRDVKPQNVFYSYNSDNQLEVVLGDWGSSVFINSYDHSPRTNIVQTLWYRAPEVLLHQKGYTDKIDVWSLGLVIAEILRGTPLFKGHNSIDQLFQIFELCGTPAEYSDIFPVRNDVRAAYIYTHDDVLLQELLLAMIELDPTKRFDIYQVLSHPYFNKGVYTSTITEQIQNMPMYTPSVEATIYKRQILDFCRENMVYPRTFFLACRYIDVILQKDRKVDPWACISLAARISGESMSDPAFRRNQALEALDFACYYFTELDYAEFLDLKLSPETLAVEMLGETEKVTFRRIPSRLIDPERTNLVYGPRYYDRWNKAYRWIRLIDPSLHIDQSPQWKLIGTYVLYPDILIYKFLEE